MLLLFQEGATAPDACSCPSPLWQFRDEEKEEERMRKERATRCRKTSLVRVVRYDRERVKGQEGQCGRKKDRVSKGRDGDERRRNRGGKAQTV
jgi:hypothetical protein